VRTQATTERGPQGSSSRWVSGTCDCDEQSTEYEQHRAQREGALSSPAPVFASPAGEDGVPTAGGSPDPP